MLPYIERYRVTLIFLEINMPTGQQATYAGAGGLVGIGKVREHFGNNPEVKTVAKDVIKASRRLPKIFHKKFINFTSNQT